MVFTVLSIPFYYRSYLIWVKKSMIRRKHWRRQRRILATKLSKTDNILKRCCCIRKLSMQVSRVPPPLLLPPPFPILHWFPPFTSINMCYRLVRSNESIVFYQPSLGPSKNEQMGRSIVRCQICGGAWCRYAQSIHHRHQMSDQTTTCSGHGKNGGFCTYCSSKTTRIVGTKSAWCCTCQRFGK